MANTNAPFGLSVIGVQGSPPSNFANTTLKNGILYTNNTAIYSQDLVKISSNGYLYQWAAGTATTADWGIFFGCRYYSNSAAQPVFRPYWPGTDAASGTVDAFFLPGQLATPLLFKIQTDSTGITQADIGANADIVVGTGSTSGGCFSGSYLDVSTISTTNTLPLRIVDLWANRCPVGPGTAAGAYNWAVVALNNMSVTGVV